MGKSDKEKPGKGGKRKREEKDEDGGGASTSGKEGPTIGMQTSSVKNKLVRSELYAKLKHKQKVRDC